MTNHNNALGGPVAGAAKFLVALKRMFAEADLSQREGVEPDSVKMTEAFRQAAQLLTGDARVGFDAAAGWWIAHAILGTATSPQSVHAAIEEASHGA